MATISHELQHKPLNIKEGNSVKIDTFEEQKKTNKIISNKLRSFGGK